MTIDPFAGVLPETNDTPKKVAVTKTADTTPASVEDAMAYFEAVMTITDEDYEEPQPYVPYIKPADGVWIPLRITDVKVEPREQRLVVAYTKDGQRVIDPRKFADVITAGGEEVVEEGVVVHQFRIEAQHIATHFGERNSPFLLFCPILDIKIALRSPKRLPNGDTQLGFDKSSGRKLLAATRVGMGRNITEDEDLFKELAAALVGKAIMAKVRRRTSPSTSSKPRINPADGSFVKAKSDPSTGSVIRLTRNGNVFFYKTDADGHSAGDAYEGDIPGLIPFDGDFLIPDSSDEAQIVRDTFEQTNVFDNLADDVYRVPSVVMDAKQVTKDITSRFEVDTMTNGKKLIARYETIRRTDGTEEACQTTWETVGFVTVSGKKPGVAIQATTPSGQTITATWLGTHWEETKTAHVMQVSEDGVPRLVPVGGPDLSGLDEFKG